MAPEPRQPFNKGARISSDRDAASVHFSREPDMNDQRISATRYSEFDTKPNTSYGRSANSFGSRAGDNYSINRNRADSSNDTFRSDSDSFRSNIKQNPVRQPAMGLRDRTEQIESDNNANRQRMAGKSGPQQGPGQPTSSGPSRNTGQNNTGQNNTGQNNAGYGGQRQQGGYGGMNGGMNGGRYGGMGGGYGGYGGGGMYGMGGMGMGMGMGMGSHMMMGPFSWIYSLNSIVHSIPMMMDVLGMNSQMLYNLYVETCTMLMKIVNIVKRSDFRRFLQQKSRRSKALRMIFVIVSMGLASQAVRLAKLIAEHNFSQRRKLL